MPTLSTPKIQPPENSPVDRRHVVLPWIVFAVTIAVRVAAALALAGSPLAQPRDGDPRFYLDWAERIVAGQWTEGQAFYGMPGYAFLLAGLLALTGGNLLAVAIVQGLADGLVATLILRIAGRVLAPSPGATAPIRPVSPLAAGVLAALLWAFYTPATAYSLVPMPAAWLTLGFWLAIDILLRRRFLGHPDSHPAYQIGLGALVGLSATLAAQALALLPLALARAWAAAPGGARALRRRSALVAALVAGTAAGTAPCWVHNVFVAREPVFLSAHSGFNLYAGNNPSADGYPRMPDGMRQDQAGSLADSKRFAEAVAGRPLRNFEVSRHWSARARAFVREHPGAWLGLLARKAAHVANAFEFDDIGLLDGLRRSGIVPPGIAFGFAALIGLPGALVALRRHPGTRPVAVALALFALALLPMCITERYRLALAPGLLLFGAILLCDMGAWVRSRAWGRLAAAAALVTVTGAFIRPPPPDDPIRTVGLHNAALTASQLGDDAAAEQLLRRALVLSPSDTGANAALGDLLLRQGRIAEAIPHYHRTLDARPDDTRVLHNLGLAEMLRGRRAEAMRALRKAATLNPSPDTLELLRRCSKQPARPGQPPGTDR